MRLLMITTLALTLAQAPRVEAQPLAFPGAVGWAATTPGLSLIHI